MPNAERSNSCIVNCTSSHLGPAPNSFQRLPETFPFVKQPETRRLQPVPDLNKGIGRRSRRLIDTRVRNYRIELEDARPGYRPSGVAFSQFRNHLVSWLIPLRISAMGVDKDVRIDSRHLLLQAVDQIPNRLPLSLNDRRLHAIPLEAMPLKTKTLHRYRRQLSPQRPFHDFA